MGQDVRNDSRFCQIPQGPQKDLIRYSRPNPVLVAVSLTLILTTAGLMYYWMLPIPLLIIEGDTPPTTPLPLSPHVVIVIDGDANFSDTALLEGWPGDGSPENPFIINGLEIDNGGICIRNTRVSFTISNYSFTGMIGGMHWEAGIYLENVINGEIVHNNFSQTDWGIYLYDSYSNTVVNNTCNGNEVGIYLRNSDSNTVANNTCSNLNEIGIDLRNSDSNTVVSNTCNGNEIGIYLRNSDSNTVANNTYNSNEFGIYLYDSDFNTVANNICTGNSEHGIYIYYTDSNRVANNITEMTGAFDPVVLLLIGLVGIMLLGGGWIAAKRLRVV